MHRQMADMMKKMGGMGKGGMLKQALGGMFGTKGPGGGTGAMPDLGDPKAMEEAARTLGAKLPGGPGGLGGLGLPGGLSGLGGLGRKK